MQSRILTQSAVYKLKAKDKQYKVSDGKVTGLFVRVQPTGRKSYYCYYRVSGKASQVKLGAVEIMSLGQARAQAAEVLVKARAGISEARERKLRACDTLIGFYNEQYKEWVETQHANPKDATRAIETTFKHWHSKRLDEIDKPLVDKWRVQQGHLSPATVNRYISSLKACLNKAVEWKYIDISPLAKFSKLKEHEVLVEWLSPEHEQRLLSELQVRDRRKREQRLQHNAHLIERGHKPLPVPEDYEVTVIDHLTPIVILALNTGLRLGECLGLQWKDVSLGVEPPTVTVRQSKSGKVRVIPLNPNAYLEMRAWKRWQKAVVGKQPQFVFTNTQGKKLNSVRSSWRRLVEDADLAPLGFHALRRTFGSKLVAKGIPILRVSKLLGHHSVIVTERHYVGVLQSENVAAVGTLAEVL
ncbi:MAG: tyrosine-type recombinase/integrase [Halioglobus sp.]